MLRDVSDAFAIVKPGVHKATRPESSPTVCAMQWPRPEFIATCVAFFVLAGGLGAGRAVRPVQADPASSTAPAPLAPPFAHPPLAGTLSLTDGYGAARSDHFHAGVDLSTGGRVGAVVYAPMACEVVRVRASGVGYGRGLYLKCEDGRTVVFGHLDAFAPTVAAYVDSAQERTGRYEQDLTPPPGRFRFASGALVAWSGESGAGAPHLHVEVRHDDFALHPLRAGIVVADRDSPVLDALTLEPLEADAWVERSAAPFTQALAADGETLVVRGAVRAVVRAHDRVRDGRGTSRDLPPWSVATSFNGITTEARFDSISWAGEMSQMNLLMDRGRIERHTVGMGVVLYAPDGIRPRFLRGAASEQDSLRKRIGILTVKAGDPPRPLLVTARDAAGLTATRRVWLRGARTNEGPDTLLAHGTRAAVGLPRWSFANLPDKWVRIRVTNTPPGISQVRIERGRDGEDGRAANWDGEGWVTLLRCKGIPDEEGFWIKAVGQGGKAWWSRGSFTLWPAGADLPIDESPYTRVTLLPTNVFEASVAMGSLLPPERASGGELTAVTPVVVLEPAEQPIARPATVRLKVPDGVALAHLGVAMRAREGEAWEWIRTSFDSTDHVFSGETGSFGQIALMRDRVAPRVTLEPAPHGALPGPYSRWALSALVSDAGSGIDSAESAFTIDGGRVATEYDPDAHVLRWRPLAPPSLGRHTVLVEAVDKAGNRTRASGVFVLDSASHH